MTSMLIPVRRSAVAALSTGVLLLLSAAPASARVETLRWSHSSSADVDGFRVHYGTASRSYTTTLDLGKPTPINGVYSYDLNVPDTAVVYVATTAYGAGFLESDYSNEKLLAGPDPEPEPEPEPEPTPPPTTPPPTPPPPPTTPPPGAQWSQDFESSATGTAVPAWRDTAANSSLNENDSLFAVIDLAGNRVFSTSSEARNIHSHYAGTGSGDWSHYELRGRMRKSGLAGGIGVTIYSQFPQADIYYRLRTFDGGAFEMAPHPHGASVSCDPATTGVLPEANTWYRFRLRVTPLQGANSIQAKAWPDGTSEPVVWQVTCTDTRGNRPTKGTIGVYHSGPGTSEWDDFAVIPLGGSAVTAPPLPPVLLPTN